MDIRKQKIIHLLSNPFNSAITEYALRLGQIFKSFPDRYENLFIVLKNSPAAKRCRELNLPVEEISFFGFYQVFICYFRARFYTADVFFCYGGRETFFAQCFRSNRQRMFRFLGNERSLESGWGLKYFRTTGFIVPSELFLKVAASKTTKPIYKIPLVYPRKDFEENRFELRPVEPPRILIFGRLDPVKGHEAALRFYAKWTQVQTKFKKDMIPRLLIAGKAENVSHEALRKIASELGIVIELIDGHILNRNQMMRDSVIGWIPSLGSEWITRVAQEFLLNGTPICVSPSGALKECILTAKDGIVIDLKADPHLQFDSFTDLLMQSVSESDVQRKERQQRAFRVYSQEEGMKKKIADILER